MNTHTKTLILIIGVVFGIIVGEVSGYASEVAVLIILLVVVQTILLVGSKRWAAGNGSATEGRASFVSLLTILFSLGLFVGIIRVQLMEEKINFVCESSCTIDAKIISSPETKNDYQVFVVQPTNSDDEVLGIQVRAPLYPKYQIGETIKISGKVIEPSIIFPHGDKKLFDYASYLLTRNIGSESLYPHIEIINTEAHTAREKLGRWKENLIGRMDLFVSSPASSLASGMLFGASSVQKDLTQTFRVAGLSHIIVLSGFNIAIVIATILFVLAFLPLVLRIALASISVIIFVMMVGAEPSVIRATLMAFIALLAMLLGREYVARSALILSLLLIVLYEPYALMHDVSLHLSFLATAGIVYLSEPFGKIFARISSETIRGLTVTTVSAYLATLPYIMYTFGTVSVYALVANIIVLPFVPVAMLVSFLVVASSYLPAQAGFSHTLATLFGFMDTVLINFMIWIARVIEFLPFSYLSFTISFQTMCLLYVLIVALVAYLYLKNKNETRSTIENGALTDIIPY